MGHGVYALIADARPLAGNTTVAVGSDGIILVDTQFAGLYSKIGGALAGVSKLPVRFVINTHYHGDHVGGNEAWGKSGALLVAHENAAQRMADPPKRADGSTIEPVPPLGLPVITYGGTGMTLRVGGQTAQLLHPALPAHSDGDTIVWFPEANIVATGDIFTPLFYPGMEIEFGAGIDGLIAAVDVIDALANDRTRIVPGHGRVSSKADLAEYRAMLVTARTRIANSKAEGMTEQQVVDAELLADLNPRWLQPGGRAARFPTLVYRSLK